MNRNETLFHRSQQLIPGGVNSPVRAFLPVGGTPVFLKRGQGAYVWDENNTRYIDYVGSWGPMIAGHAHPEVVATVTEAIPLGFSFGTPSALELEMAETLTRLVPSMEQVRLVSSGTEATMSAIRLARGHTGRDKIIKFEGCYHGHADALLVKAGSGALTHGTPSSAGVPSDFTRHTLVLPYNNIAALDEAFARWGSEIAGAIVEPIAGNMNLVRPDTGFLASLRAHCTQSGAVLIFDEVMTGFRVGLGGAQALYQITPDLTTLGKIIGGGLPVGAFGGKRTIMAKLAPSGTVYQAGTLSGNPIALSAGLATLKIVQTPGFYEALAKTTAQLINGINRLAQTHGVALVAQHVGGMFGLYFRESLPTCFADVMQCDTTAFRLFFNAMLQQGVYLAPSAFETGFVSSAHTEVEIEATLACIDRALQPTGA